MLQRANNWRDKMENAEEWEVVDPEMSMGGFRWVAVIVDIKKVSTGEVREYESTQPMKGDESSPSTFNWAENNFSCDCNRSLFFSRSKGEDEDEDQECTDGKYKVRLRNKKTGSVYYSEFDS